MHANLILVNGALERLHLSTKDIYDADDEDVSARVQLGDNSATDWLMFACDHGMKLTRARCVSKISRSIPLHISDLFELACDDDYTDAMAELWPAIRDRLLSPEQIEGNAMVDPPTPEMAP
jgi:hypothetical protein